MLKVANACMIRACVHVAHKSRISRSAGQKRRRLDGGTCMTISIASRSNRINWVQLKPAIRSFLVDHFHEIATLDNFPVKKRLAANTYRRTCETKLMTLMQYIYAGTARPVIVMSARSVRTRANRRGMHNRYSITCRFVCADRPDAPYMYAFLCSNCNQRRRPP